MAARKKKSRGRGATRAAKPRAKRKKRSAPAARLRVKAKRASSARAAAKPAAAKRSASRQPRVLRVPPQLAPTPPAALSVLASEPLRAGVVRHFFARARVALVALEAPLAAGDRIYVRGATSDFVASIAGLRVGDSAVARAEGGEVTLALPERARPGDVVYALRPPA